MYIWQKRYQDQCPTGRFVFRQNYEIHRRGYIVNLWYYGSVSTRDGNKVADIFYGKHNGGVNKDETLAFALMNGRYASSNNMGKALQKLWSGKTNKLHGIFREEQGRLVRV